MCLGGSSIPVLGSARIQGLSQLTQELVWRILLDTSEIKLCAEDVRGDIQYLITKSYSLFLSPESNFKRDRIEIALVTEAAYEDCARRLQDYLQDKFPHTPAEMRMLGRLVAAQPTLIGIERLPEGIPEEAIKMAFGQLEDKILEVKEVTAQKTGATFYWITALLYPTQIEQLLTVPTREICGKQAGFFLAGEWGMNQAMLGYFKGPANRGQIELYLTKEGYRPEVEWFIVPARDFINRNFALVTFRTLAALKQALRSTAGKNPRFLLKKNAPKPTRNPTMARN